MNRLFYSLSTNAKAVIDLSKLGNDLASDAGFLGNLANSSLLKAFGAFNVALWDAPNPAQTIYRSKAVGEPPLMLGISAFLALSDAVANCGSNYPNLQAPATAEEVLRAIKRARG